MWLANVCRNPEGTWPRSISEADFGSRMRNWLHMAEGARERGPGCFAHSVLNCNFKGNVQHGDLAGFRAPRGGGDSRARLPEGHPLDEARPPGPTFLTSPLPLPVGQVPAGSWRAALGCGQHLSLPVFQLDSPGSLGGRQDRPASYLRLGQGQVATGLWVPIHGGPSSAVSSSTNWCLCPL